MDARADERGREVRPRVLTRGRTRNALLGAFLGLGLIAGPATAASVLVSPTGNVVVLLRPGTHRAHAAALFGEPAGRQVPAIGLITLRPRPGESVATLLSRLRADPAVASVAPERRLLPRSVPNDPGLSEIDPASGLSYQWYLLQESFPAAWDLTRGARTLLGVIDTGVDATHPELRGKVAAAIEQEGATAARGTARTDEVGHGTHVSSIACAATDDGIGIAGAGWGCSLVEEKSDFTDSSVAASIVDATDRGVKALNMSFGPSDPSAAGPAPESEVRAVHYALAHGVVLVAAASDTPGTEQGDPGNVLQPAGSGPTLGSGLGLDVTAAQQDGTRAAFAGSGTEISLAAYGAVNSSANPLLPCAGSPTGLFAAFPANQADLEQYPPTACRAAIDGDRRYAYLAGTSMAAPQVAAVAAMMRTLNPDASVADVIRTIEQTATRGAGAAGWTPDLGWGVLSAGRALQAWVHVDRTPPVSVLRAPAVSPRRTVILRWAGADPARRGLIPSGVERYVLSVSRGRGPARVVFSAPPERHSYGFVGVPGVRYVFTLTAVDRAGNRQRRPSRVSVRFAAPVRRG